MAAVALPTFEPGFRFTTLAEAAAVVPEPAAAADPAAGMRYAAFLPQDWCIGVGNCPPACAPPRPPADAAQSRTAASWPP